MEEQICDRLYLIDRVTTHGTEAEPIVALIWHFSSRLTDVFSFLTLDDLDGEVISFASWADATDSRLTAGRGCPSGV